VHGTDNADEGHDRRVGEKALTEMIATRVRAAVTGR
jgi:hypothetical protein